MKTNLTKVRAHMRRRLYPSGSSGRYRPDRTDTLIVNEAASSASLGAPQARILLQAFRSENPETRLVAVETARLVVDLRSITNPSDYRENERDILKRLSYLKRRTK